MHSESDKLNDNYLMSLAIRQAKEAEALGDVPVGAVLVMGGHVYSGSGNRRENAKDPTGHAEILAIRHAAERTGSWRLLESTLYVTTEPCVMCSGAIYLARIPKVVFGCTNPKGGALRFIQENRKKLGLNHSVEIVTGIREIECAQLLRGFFTKKRKTNGENSPRL